MRRFLDHYRRGLGMSARNNALAYGYSITSTASFGVLAHTSGPTSTGRVFAFVVGAGLSFATINALVTRGFRETVQTEPRLVLALATSLSVLSISAGVGVALLLGTTIGGWVSWLLAAILASWVYLGVSALEVAAARTLHLTAGTIDEDGD